MRRFREYQGLPEKYSSRKKDGTFEEFGGTRKFWILMSTDEKGPTKKTLVKFRGTEDFQKNMIFKKAAHPQKNLGFPEMPGKS